MLEQGLIGHFATFDPLFSCHSSIHNCLSLMEERERKRERERESVFVCVVFF
jgi:hypothetical protein